MLVALHHAQSLPEKSVLGLDILGIKFATTREQSLSELCLAARLSPGSGLPAVGLYCVEIRFLWCL